MVDHLTRVTADAGAPHAEAIGEALASIGFAVTRDGGRITGESSVVEAREARERLRAYGVPDREYRIVLEYVRQWGIL